MASRPVIKEESFGDYDQEEQNANNATNWENLTTDTRWRFDEFSEKEQAVVNAVDGDLDKLNDLQKRLERASRKSQLLGLGEDQETASEISQNDDLSEQVPLDKEQIKRIRNKVKLTRQKTQIFTTIFESKTGREGKFKKQSEKMSEKRYKTS